MDSSYQEDCALRGISEVNCSLFQKLVTDFKSTSAFWLLVVAISFMISNASRAMRWQLMLRPLGYEARFFNSLSAIMVGYFVNLGIPRAGEFARASVMTKYENVPFENAFGTIITDRILDVVCLLIMLGLGFLFHYDVLVNYIASKSSVSTNTLYLILLGFIIIGVISIWTLKKLLSLDEQRISPYLLKIRNLYKGFIEGVLSVFKIPNWPLLLIHSVIIWLMYLLMHYFAFLAFEPTAHLGLKEALLVFDFGTLGIVFPSPGGMGTYHAMIGEGLKIFNIDSLTAFSFSMITFITLNLGCNAIFGLLSLISLPIFNKSK